MPYFFLEDSNTTTAAIRLEGRDLEELFSAAAEALLSVQLRNPSELQARTFRTFRMAGTEPARLLHRFLEELIRHRESEGILLRPSRISVTVPDLPAAVEDPTDSRVPGYPRRMELSAETEGEPVDPARHQVGTEVRSVSWHRFAVEHGTGGWSATVVLDT